MRKTIALWSILALCMTLTAVVPSASAVSDRVWLALGTDTNVSAGTMITGFVNAVPGEVVTVNWKAGVLDSSHPLQIQFYPSIPAMNWTGYEYYSYVTTRTLYYQNPFIGSPPGAAWIRSGGFDVICIRISNAAGAPTVTFNVTVTQDSWTYKQDLSAVDEKISALNSTMQENFTAIRDAISGLRASLDSMNLSENADVVQLQDQLDALNASLVLSESALRALMDMNDTALRALIGADYANLTEQLQRVNVSVTNITNVTSNITERVEYNDSALWSEIGRLNATPPVTIVQVNNTTVVNKTEVNTTEINPTTFVNRTETLSAGNNEVVAGAVAGVATGAIVSGAGVALIDRRMRKRYGGLAPLQV